MTKRLSGVVLVASLLAPLSLAHAATEVTRFSANNTFANAISTDEATGTTTGVFVTRSKGGKGGTVDSIFFVISGPTETIYAQGILPRGAFRVDGTGASLNVDVADVTLVMDCGCVPAHGIISAEWDVTDRTRTSGNTHFDFGGVHVVSVATGTTAVSTVSGSVLGAEMVAPMGDMTALREATIMVSKD